jgi:uncharacterized membrane protein YjgN (DUF898 family)
VNAELPATRLRGGFSGGRAELLSLVLRTVALTLLTLGIYSFWARTRLRRWIWSSIRMGDAPLEYVGEPQEKAAGFALAAVMVAFWFGPVVMLLAFASVQWAHTPEYGLTAGFAALLPVYWFAQYRGRRYLLTHTRWRGLSFSLAPGAWGYTMRAVLWSLLALLSFGLLVPLRRHRLFRYVAERASYGDGRFRSVAGARDLWRPWIPALLSLWAVAAVVVYAGANEEPEALWLLLGAGPVALLAWINWRVASTRHLVSGLRWGRTAALSIAPRTGRVVRLQALGWVVVVAILAALAPFASGLVYALALDGQQVALGLDLDLSGIEIAVGVLVFYALLFVLRAGLRTAFVTWPVIAHVGETATLDGAQDLATARPGVRRAMVDADGFANLFDMGAGI